MINIALRSCLALVIAAVLLPAPRLAAADQQSPAGAPAGAPPMAPQPVEPYAGPPSGQPPSGYPPPYPLPPPGYGPPPAYGPPIYAPPIAGPAQITNFDENSPVPYGYTRVQKTRKGLVIGGAVTFGVTYGLCALIAAADHDLRTENDPSEDLSSLWIPVVGPFVQLGSTDSATGKLYLFHVGLAQTVGAVMLVYGLTSPRTVLVRNDRLSISPMIGNGTSGMMVSGRF